MRIFFELFTRILIVGVISNVANCAANPIDAQTEEFGLLPIGSRIIVMHPSQMDGISIRDADHFPIGLCTWRPFPAAPQTLQAGDILHLARKEWFTHGLTSAGFDFWLRLNDSVGEDYHLSCSRPLTAPDFTVSDFMAATSGRFQIEELKPPYETRAYASRLFPSGARYKGTQEGSTR
jgi:hypothetical protein